MSDVVPSQPPPPPHQGVPSSPDGFGTLGPLGPFGPFTTLVSLTAAGNTLALERTYPTPPGTWPPAPPLSSPAVGPESDVGPESAVIDAALLLWGHPVGTLQTFAAAASGSEPLSALFGRLSLRGPIELVIQLPPHAHRSVVIHPSTPDEPSTGRPTALALVADLGSAHLRVAISGITAPRLLERPTSATPDPIAPATAAPPSVETAMALDGGEYFFELRLASTEAEASVNHPLNRPAHFRARQAAVAAQGSQAPESSSS